MGFFRGSNNQKFGKCHELPRKSKKHIKNPLGGGSFRGSRVVRGWREGGADGKEGTGREKGRGWQAGKEGARAKPGNQLVIHNCD